jgi:hypothetical protein
VINQTLRECQDGSLLPPCVRAHAIAADSANDSCHSGTLHQRGLAPAKRENAQASSLGVRRWRCLSLTRTRHNSLTCTFVYTALLRACDRSADQ